jgi:hypothetical protein
MRPHSRAEINGQLANTAQALHARAHEVAPLALVVLLLLLLPLPLPIGFAGAIHECVQNVVNAALGILAAQSSQSLRWAPSERCGSTSIACFPHGCRFELSPAFARG